MFSNSQVVITIMEMSNNLIIILQISFLVLLTCIKIRKIYCSNHSPMLSFRYVFLLLGSHKTQFYTKILPLYTITLHP